MSPFKGNYVADHIRDFVALQAKTRWQGASSSHMSELLLAEKGLRLSAKTITRILKERGIKSPFTHKGPRKHRRREAKGAARGDGPDRRLTLRLGSYIFSRSGFENLKPRMNLHLVHLEGLCR
jgi:hypothetical protein